MTVINVHSDPARLTLSLTAEFDAPVERVWQLWADPRQLERWWGPPGYPATMTKVDLRPGGRVEYHLTGPAGDVLGGVWEVLDANPPHSLALRDAITEDDGRPSDEGPSGMTVSIAQIADGRTRMLLEFQFLSHADLESALEMKMDEGLTFSVGQADAIIAESPAQILAS